MIQTGLIFAVIITGLIWRSGWLPLPQILFKYGGDALWAMVVYLGLGWLFRNARAVPLAITALAISWAVEFFQIYRAPWIDAIRSTLPGRLVLGTTFNAPDLAAYAVGILLVAAIEHICRSKQSGKLTAHDGSSRVNHS
ncbi:MAG: DUF2809 domain-containing protein [Akkermansiaceae bacterium]|nr:DUF2809 domain-containing protein [Akkermansiaceae bacterium]